MKNMETKKQTGLGKKGFSLVELIIVIAIMAILIGIIGSQAIPYLEKSRRAKDVQTLDTVFSDFNTAIAEALTQDSLATVTGAKLTALDSKLQSALKELNPSLYASDASLGGKFKSNDSQDGATPGSKNDVKFTYRANNEATSPGYVSVEIGKLIVTN